MYKLETMEFGRRMTVERELDRFNNKKKKILILYSTIAPPSNVIFDESGNFVMYSTMIGIKCKR